STGWSTGRLDEVGVGERAAGQKEGRVVVVVSQDAAHDLVDPDPEVVVVAGREPRVADLRDRLTTCHQRAGLDQQAAAVVRGVADVGFDLDLDLVPATAAVEAAEDHLPG